MATHSAHLSRSPGPFYRKVGESLRRKISDGGLAADALLPSESDLCAQYKASRKTIRSALTLLEREGLVVAIPGVGRRVRGAGGHPVVSNCESIPFLMRPDKPSGRLAVLLHPRLEERGFRLWPVIADYAEPKTQTDNFSRLAAHAASASIVQFDSRQSEGFLAGLAAARHPIVLAGAQARLGMDAVDVDHAAAVELAIAHATRLGHRRVSLLTSDILVARHPSYQVSAQAYELAAHRAGIEPVVARCRWNDWTLPDAERLLIGLLEKNDSPLCLLVYEGDSVMQVLSTLHRHGATVPRDVSIIALRDHFLDAGQLAAFGLSDVTRVAEPWEEVADIIAERVVERANGRGGGPRLILAQPRLIEGASVARFAKDPSHASSPTT